WLTGQSIEDEQHPAHLRDLRDGGYAPAVLHDVDQRGRRGEIRVEEVVTRRLEVPLVCAGVRIERDDRHRVEVVPGTVAAVEAPSRIAGRNEHQAAFGVHR